MTFRYQAQYEHTEAEAAQFGAEVVDYIYVGGETCTFSANDLRGLCVFGAIGAIREATEQDPLFLTRTDNGHQARLDIVNTAIKLALDKNMHYSPFGHKNPARYEPEDADEQQRLSQMMSSIE